MIGNYPDNVSATDPRAPWNEPEYAAPLCNHCEEAATDCLCACCNTPGGEQLCQACCATAGDCGGCDACSAGIAV